MLRKTTITVLVLILIWSFPVLAFGKSESGASENSVKTASVSSKKVKRLPIRLKSNMKSISVIWKTKKNIKRYVIYRIDVTKDVTDQDYDHKYYDRCK